MFHIINIFIILSAKLTSEIETEKECCWVFEGVSCFTNDRLNLTVWHMDVTFRLTCIDTCEHIVTDGQSIPTLSHRTSHQDISAPL